MTPNQIQCEALNVRTDTKTCLGLAKTVQGEMYLLDARTPGPKGICCQAFAAMNSMRMALAVTGQNDLDNLEYLDVTCPHGAVTFRLSRKK